MEYSHGREDKEDAKHSKTMRQGTSSTSPSLSESNNQPVKGLVLVNSNVDSSTISSQTFKSAVDSVPVPSRQSRRISPKMPEKPLEFVSHPSGKDSGLFGRTIITSDTPAGKVKLVDRSTSRDKVLLRSSAPPNLLREITATEPGTLKSMEASLVRQIDDAYINFMESKIVKSSSNKPWWLSDSYGGSILPGYASRGAMWCNTVDNFIRENISGHSRSQPDYTPIPRDRKSVV